MFHNVSLQIYIQDINALDLFISWSQRQWYPDPTCHQMYQLDGIPGGYND